MSVHISEIRTYSHMYYGFDVGINFHLHIISLKYIPLATVQHPLEESNNWKCSFGLTFISFDLISFLIQ